MTSIFWEFGNLLFPYGNLGIFYSSIYKIWEFGNYSVFMGFNVVWLAQAVLFAGVQVDIKGSK